MSDERPAIPRPLERQVLVEAGHRCAITQCRQVPVEIAHIEPWSNVREHRFENLIALCPTCHARHHNGQIDRLALRRYKANLSVVSGRYGDLERRVLESFATLTGVPAPAGTSIVLPRSLSILMMYLTRDGLVEQVTTEVPEDSPAPAADIAGSSESSSVVYRLTDKGAEFIKHWLSAEELE